MQPEIVKYLTCLEESASGQENPCLLFVVLFHATSRGQSQLLLYFFIVRLLFGIQGY